VPTNALLKTAAHPLGSLQLTVSGFRVPNSSLGIRVSIRDRIEVSVRARVRVCARVRARVRLRVRVKG
jgi:hypothetical protein